MDIGSGDADGERATAMKVEGYYGATSEYLAPKATYFNILYSHPLYGCMPPWGEVQHRIKRNEPLGLLPPVNSVKGSMVDPALRRQTRVSWGPTAKGNAFLPLHLTDLPGSPIGRHPAPTPEMASVANLSALGKVPYQQNAPESTNPWLRNPPHRDRTAQMYEAMYGPKERKPLKAKGMLG